MWQSNPTLLPPPPPPTDIYMKSNIDSCHLSTTFTIISRFASSFSSSTIQNKRIDQPAAPSQSTVDMKLVWSPELASKAYIDTVESCQQRFQESSVAELVSAMAAGWSAKLIVETWSSGGVLTTSVGLAVAAHHASARHVCIVPDEESRREYLETVPKKTPGVETEIIVGEPEEAVAGLMGIDFLVVDCGKNDFARIFQIAKLGTRGAVLVCKNASSRADTDFRWRGLLDGGSRRIVRSVFLPVGNGLDIAHVSAADGKNSAAAAKAHSRWFKHIDRNTGEEFAIRK